MFAIKNLLALTLLTSSFCLATNDLIDAICQSDFKAVNQILADRTLTEYEKNLALSFASSITRSRNNSIISDWVYESLSEKLYYGIFLNQFIPNLTHAIKHNPVIDLKYRWQHELLTFIYWMSKAASFPIFVSALADIKKNYEILQNKILESKSIELSLMVPQPQKR